MFSAAELQKIGAEFERSTFAGKRVLVTGVRKGAIGCAAAALFKELGCAVFAAAESAKTIAVARRTLKKLSIELDGWEVADFSRAEAGQKLGGKVLHKYGPPDILCNIAGVTPSRAQMFPNGSLVSESVLWNVNYFAPLELTRVLIGEMMRRKSGTVFFMGSSNGVAPQQGFSAYAASKAALEVLARAMANDVAHSRVAVFCVRAGFIEVERHERALLRKIARSLPSGKVTTALQIAAAIARHSVSSALPQTGCAIDFTSMQIGSRRG